MTNLPNHLLLLVIFCALVDFVKIFVGRLDLFVPRQGAGRGGLARFGHGREVRTRTVTEVLGY